MTKWCCKSHKTICAKRPCRDGCCKGVVKCPIDVGKEKSLITSNNDIPGNFLQNLSTRIELMCKGASGAITYTFVSHKGYIIVAFAQYTKCPTI